MIRSRDSLIEALGRTPDVMKNVDLLAVSGENTADDLTIEVWEFHFDDGRMVEMSVGTEPAGFYPQTEVRIEKQGEGTLARYRESVEELVATYEEGRSFRGDRETDAKIHPARSGAGSMYSREASQRHITLPIR